MMNISYGIGPAITKDEIDGLIACGVGEFFLGIIPPEWKAKYGSGISPNKRVSDTDNFTDYRSFGEVIGHIRARKKKVHIVLNDFMYTRTQLQDMAPLLARLETYEPDAYVIGDVALILQLERWRIARKVHVGITGGCLNQYALAFFKRFKAVKRVNLPRFLSLKEIAAIRKSTDLELGCFGVTGFCEFGEEYCFTFHSDEKEVFCNREYGLLGKGGTLQPRAAGVKPAVKLRCGLCAMYYFNKIGIDSVKFPGRGHAAGTFTALRHFRGACAAANIKEVRALRGGDCRGGGDCVYNMDGIK